MQRSLRNLLEVNLWISNVSAAWEGSWARAFAGSGLSVDQGGQSQPLGFESSDRRRGSASVGVARLPLHPGLPENGS